MENDNTTPEKKPTYYSKHKEKMDERNKEWKKTNREKWNAYQAAYKKRKYRLERGLPTD